MVAIPDPATFQLMPRPSTTRARATKVGRMICDVVTPDGTPYEGDPRYVLRRALERMKKHGLRHVQRRPRARVLPLQGRQGHGDARRGRLLRDDDAGRGDRAAQRHDHGARVGGHPDRVPPPRGRPVAARDRHALRDALDDGRPHDHLPAGRQGDRREGTATTRPSCRSRSSARTARACTRTSRSSRAAATQFFDAEDQWHLSDDGKAFIAGLLAPRARDLGRASRSGSTRTSGSCPGYEAPVYVAWSQRNRSALIRIPLYKPGSEQATRAEIRCPDPACNPYLDLRGAAARGPRGDREGLRAARPDGDEPLPPLRGGADASAGIVALPGDARRGDRRARAARSCCRRRSASTSSTRYVELKRQGVGRVPRPAHRSGSSTATWRRCRCCWPTERGRMRRLSRGLPAACAPSGRLDPTGHRFTRSPNGASSCCRCSRKASGAPVSDGRSRVPDEGPVVVCGFAHAGLVRAGSAARRGRLGGHRHRAA